MKELQRINQAGRCVGGALRPIHHRGHTEATEDALGGDWKIGYLGAEAKERSKVYQERGWIQGFLVRIVGKDGGLSCWCLYNAGASSHVSSYVLR